MNLPTILKLKTELDAQLDEAARHWLHESFANNDENNVFTHSAAARRYCGDQQFVTDISAQRIENVIEDYHRESSELVGGQCSLTDVARIVLLGCVSDALTDEASHELLKNYYRCGDELEKAALLKGMNLLDAAGAAVQIAINACRVNSLIIYKAIALHNPYPCTFFPELNWNQLVLKTLFQRLDINDIVGLNARQNPTLSAMCLAYAEELILADRDPPPSIWLAMHLNDIDKKAIHLFTRFLNDNNPLHRFYVVSSLSKQTLLNLETRQALHQAIDSQRRKETDAAVLRLLTDLNI